MPQSYRGHVGRNIDLQQTRQQTATAENSSIFSKNMCVSARWFASCDDHHILHTDTWLRDDHPGKCCSKSCYAVELQVAKCKKHANRRRKQCHCSYTNDHKKLLMPQSYREYSHKPWEGWLVATDKIVDCHSWKWFNLKVFLNFSTTRNAQNFLPC